jgi:hypothetical protein
MNVLNRTKALWYKVAESRSLLLMLCVSLTLGPHAYAQTQAQPASADSPRISASPDTSEVPPEVAKELQTVKARMAQMESQLKELAAFVTPSSPAARLAPSEVTLTGTVSCGHCQGIQPIHKGYTLYTWALTSVSQGDDIVLVGRDQVYKLQGDNDKLLQFMSSKARVSGRLDGSTVQVETIGRAAKNE